jgi:hypothetical protein
MLDSPWATTSQSLPSSQCGAAAEQPPSGLSGWRKQGIAGDLLDILSRSILMKKGFRWKRGKRRCPSCGSGNTRPSQRKWQERLRGLFIWRTYRCETCNLRYWAFR